MGRRETDFLGEREIPESALYGIHTLRALENFEISGRMVHPELIHALAYVKWAAAKTNAELGYLSNSSFEAIQQACREIIRGEHDVQFQLDSLQGGAGTSTNMALNEVIANRALQILGHRSGEYEILHPLDDINRHQSTNDTYPTAVKIAGLFLLRYLEDAIVTLQRSLQEKEQAFEGVVKVARTQLMDATLTTLGREFGAYAEAISRDRWRVFKCQERLRVVNLGGTAVGTGATAPRRYIFKVVENLRLLTGLNLARAENLVDATQNADVFVEVSGILKAHAANLIKIANDLRLMASGPDAGLGEIELPAVQAGSSIMAGKVNPVIPEAVIQTGLNALGSDVVINHAAALGTLELNPFLPVIADHLLQMLKTLARADRILAERCIAGIRANGEKCARFRESAQALATLLVPRLGYDAAAGILKEARRTGKSIREIVLERKLLNETEFDRLLSPENLLKLGEPD